MLRGPREQKRGFFLRAETAFDMAENKGQTSLWLLSTQAIWPPISDALHLRKPRGVGRIIAFLEGFGSGLRTRVDKATLRFV